MISEFPTLIKKPIMLPPAESKVEEVAANSINESVLTTKNDPDCF